MAYLNQVNLIGNVGYDPDIKNLEFGKIATFKLATTERYKDRNGQPKENTQWHLVSARGPLADVVEKLIRKGAQVYVGGKLEYRSWNDKDGNQHTQTEIVMHTVQMLGSRPRNEAPATQNESFEDLPFD